MTSGKKGPIVNEEKAHPSMERDSFKQLETLTTSDFRNIGETASQNYSTGKSEPRKNVNTHSKHAHSHSDRKIDPLTDMYRIRPNVRM